MLTVHQANCSTIMTVEAGAMPEMLIFKTGTLDDDSINQLKPGVEIYTKERPTCFEALAGVAQKEGA